MSKIFKWVFRFFSLIICIFVLYKGFLLFNKEVKLTDFNEDYYKTLSKSSIPNIEDSKKNFGNLSLKYNDKSVPVLMYHSIKVEKNNPYVVSPKRFKIDMQYLKKNGFTTLTTTELYDFMVKNKPIPQKSILITFDDGYEDNYTNAFPILKEYKLKATIFVITKNLNNGNHCLTSKQLKEMESYGIDIQSHTYAHDKLATYSYDEQLKTLKTSKEYLEKTLNKPVRYISYPYGSYNLNTLKAAKEAGYQMAFTTDGRWANKSNGILTLNRIFISGFHHNSSFKTRVNNSFYLFRYLYFW